MVRANGQLFLELQGKTIMMPSIKKAIEIVVQDEIMPFYCNSKFEIKRDGSVCTQADLAAQEKLKDLLRDILQAPVLGEEMSSSEQMQIWETSGDYIWCVDPIDGTSNYVNGIPYFAVSVALMQNRKTCLGAVYDPTREEFFHAEEGKGAFLNEVRLEKTIRKPLQQAIAQIDFKRLPRPIIEKLLDNRPYASQRNFGAGSLEWCYLAAGRFDIYLHGSQKLWDYAAGSLILGEAGGKLRTMRHPNFWEGDVWSKSVIAAGSEGLFKSWLDWLVNAVPEIIS